MSVMAIARALAPPPPVTTLVDQLLAEQAGRTTAVDAFSRWHARHEADGTPPGAGRTDMFRSLIPLTKPGRGEQYAFEVVLSQCTGCKACVAACHSLNGLDETETWRDVGMVVGRAGAGAGPPAPQTITTACHHCEDPACANGCPVLAYEKDAETGIVRHLDDQCIGCSYCILKCPYDVPKFNPKRGIVRKCDMCHQRLGAGEAPACVQACPTEAIRIRLVARDQPSEPYERMVPGAFPSDYTRPTTRYVGGSRPAGPNAGEQSFAADAAVLRLDPAHLPLSVMLVLTQMSAGALTLAAVLGGLARPAPPLTALITAAAGAGLLGLAVSGLHLGQPLKAWRIFLGWRKSWLSREAMIFGAFGGAAGTAAGQAWLAPTALPPWWLPGLAAALGLAGVAASAMVYVDTRRPFWSAGLVAGKFGGTTVLLGAALAAVVWSWHGAPEAGPAAFLAWTARLLLSAWETGVFRSALRRPSCPWHTSALTMQHLQPGWQRARRRLLVLTGGLLPAAALLFPSQAPVLLPVFLLGAATSQLLERHQFFTAAAGPRMPGLA